MSDKKLVEDRANDRTTKRDSRGDEVITTGIQDDMLELYNLSREEASNQLFRWYDFKKNNPKGFSILIMNDALQSPADFLEVNFGDGDTPLSNEELHRFNKRAMELYYEMVVEYLEEEPNQEEINETTGENIYQGILRNLWTKAKKGAKGEIIEELEANK